MIPELLALLVHLAAPPEAPPGRVLEEVVAVIRSPPGSAPRPVMLTRLEEETRIALVEQGAFEAAFAPLDDAALRAGLRWLVDQLIVADEAARLGVDEVAQAEIQAAITRFQGRFPDVASYRRFLAVGGISEEELGASLARSIGVARYLDGRVGHAGPGADAARARAQIGQLVAELRGRADVRVLIPSLRGGASP